MLVVLFAFFIVPKPPLTHQSFSLLLSNLNVYCAFVLKCREGARVIWSYVDRILGQPSLIRESSRGKYPWSGLLSRPISTLSRSSEKGSTSQNGKGFGDVVLHPSLQKRIQQLANATANTKSHQAPFRNMLFYGPPGTGKTMAARELARKSVCSLAFYYPRHLLSFLVLYLLSFGISLIFKLGT